jgi:hypothetical protein
MSCATRCTSLHARRYCRLRCCCCAAAAPVRVCAFATHGVVVSQHQTTAGAERGKCRGDGVPTPHPPLPDSRHASRIATSDSKRFPTLTKETDAYFAMDASSENPEVAVTRFKCPGCERTYEHSSGVMNHLKNPGHAAVDGPITQDRTRVLCKRVDGKFVAMSSIPVPIPPISQSLTQVYAIECYLLCSNIEVIR